MKRFLVSVLQFDINPDPYENFKLIERLFAIAAGRKSKFVLLPEMFATSFNYETYDEFSKHTMDVLKFLQNLGRKYNTYIIAGSLPVSNRKNNLYNNRSYIISPEGAVAGHYDKMHIFFQNQENQYFTAGSEAKAFHTFYAPIGIQICFDIRFPLPIRELTKKGIKMLFVPAQFPDPRKEHWITLLKARAIENQIYIIAANRIGEEHETSYFGHSMIIDPYGEVLLDAKGEEGVFSEYVDLDFLEAYRKDFPVLEGE
jgi:omega-amidase